MPVPEPLLPPKRTVCIYFNNAWYFEGCADEYMLIYTIKASVHFEIVLMICFVLSLVESTPLIITICFYCFSEIVVFSRRSAKSIYSPFMILFLCVCDT